MADDFVLNVRQIYQYPRGIARLGDRLLFQQQKVGGPYLSVDPVDLVGQALQMGGWLRLAPGAGLAWNGAALTFGADGFTGFEFSEQLTVPSLIAGAITVDGVGVATLDNIAALEQVLAIPKVDSFNGRTGDIVLNMDDIIAAHGAPVMSPQFFGVVRAPTIGNPRACSDEVATTAWVQKAITNFVACFHPFVFSFNGRTGFIDLSVDDIVWAGGAPIKSPRFTGQPRAPTPWWGDRSTRIANTEWVARAIATSEFTVSDAIKNYLTTYYAPLDSPQLTGVPQGPTAAPGTTTGQLATTAFVMAAVAGSVVGVSSFNTRTGAITLTAQDIFDAGGATLVSPAFSGAPTAPTASAGTSNQQLATTAFVMNALAAATAGVSSFNSRTGAVTLQLGDVTGVGGAPIASPGLTGVPTAPTAPAGTASTQIATCAWVLNEIGAISAGVTTFNGRTGAVTLNSSDVSALGVAFLSGPTFSGIPTAPTAAAGTATQQLATTAFVAAALASAVAGVASFNNRTGAVTLQASDVTGVGGALLASPTFTGTPAAPTAAPGTSSTQLATTAFVTAAEAASKVSPALSGTPTAPTATAGTNNTQLATTAFVAAAIAAIPTGGVSSFNSRTGAVTLTAADLSALGVAFLAGPALTGVPTAPTPVPGTNSSQLATTAFVTAAVSTAVGGVYQANVVTATGTFTTDANSTVTTVYRVRMQAAGGGGMGAGGATWSGAGGGGGEYKEFLLSGVAAATAMTVTIGAPGVGSAGGASPGAGGNAANTTLAFGTTNVVCVGGRGGGTVTGTGYNTGGAGGAGGATTPGAATLTMLMGVGGGDGETVTTGSQTTTRGGFARMGLPGFSLANGMPNSPGSGYGPGGVGSGIGGTAGATGRPGVVIIERISG